ncbi:MAG TPA: flavin reductase family protein [Anaeromyxobacteraceae bacterium]|nr:flavin reductase family protein [Anaeromyxobacteraceae bacterium]
MKSELFVDVLRKFPLAVSVVTVGRGGADNALTVSWAAPVAFDPPHFMIAVDARHYSVDFLKSTKNFAVNVLREGQERLAGYFARQSMTSEEKLEAVPTRDGATGAAILAEALAYFDCEIVAIGEVGDHLMVVGKVVDAAVLNDGRAMQTSAGLRYQKSQPA